MTPEELIDEWEDSTLSLVMVLEEFGIRDEDELRLNYTGASLRRIEELVVGYFGPEEICFDGMDLMEAEPISVETIAAYLGDTLLRLAGRGEWDWIAEDDLENFPNGLPVVRADAALGLPPASPVQMMIEAARRGDGEQFTATYRAWERAVERVKQTQPMWPASEYLVGWLTQRGEAFGEWVNTYSPDGAWDFSPDSLLALDELVRRVTPTEAELDDPANREFRDGAAWYLGEVLRQGLGGRWHHNDRTPGDCSGRACVEFLGIEGRESHLVVVLSIGLKEESGYLRSHYEHMAT